MIQIFEDVDDNGISYSIFEGNVVIADSLLPDDPNLEEYGGPDWKKAVKPGLDSCSV